MIRVLVADDESIERMALCRRLERHFGTQIEISQAEDGLEAVEIHRREKSRIVIMDIAMPELNGVAAAEQIRALDPDCVIIFLTAYDEFTYARRALVIRALDYLLKPCEEEELLAVMEEAIRQAELGISQAPGARGNGWPGSGKSESGRPENKGPESGENAATRGQGNQTHTAAAGQLQDDSGDSRMDQVAASIRDYISSNFMREISMQDAARAMNYSDAYFCKLFKQCFDQNFTAYLTNYRVNEAKKLLKNREMNVKEVGMRVGYFDSNYFAKVFKRLTGMIPSEFRELYYAQK